MSDTTTATAHSIQELVSAVQRLLAHRRSVYVFYDVRRSWAPQFKIYAKGVDQERAEYSPQQFMFVGVYDRKYEDAVLIDDAQAAEREYALAPWKFRPTMHRAS